MLGGLLGGGGGGGGMLGGLLGGGSGGGGLLGGLLGGGGAGGMLGGLLGGGQQQQPQGGSQIPGFSFPQGPSMGWSQPPQSPAYNFSGDLGGPGQAEQYYGQHQGKFDQPTASGGYWGQNQGKFGAPGQGDQYWNKVAGNLSDHPKPTNDAAQAYQQFQGSAPANTDPYYSHAMDTATSKLNNQFGARGMYGSSAATNAIGESNANLLGQQALANANYGLNRGQVAGQLGSAADASSRGMSQDQLAWTQGLGNLALGTQNADLQKLLGGANVAQGVDQSGLSQLLGGMGASQGAQTALRNRGNDYFSNVMGLAGPQAAAQQNLGLGALMNDQNLFDQQIQASLGYPRENLNQSLNGRASTESGIGNLFALFGGGKGGGMLGGLM